MFLPNNGSSGQYTADGCVTSNLNKRGRVHPRTSYSVNGLRPRTMQSWTSLPCRQMVHGANMSSYKQVHVRVNRLVMGARLATDNCSP